MWRWWHAYTYTPSRSRLLTRLVSAWGSCTPAISLLGVAWHAAWVSAVWSRSLCLLLFHCTFLFIHIHILSPRFSSLLWSLSQSFLRHHYTCRHLRYTYIIPQTYHLISHTFLLICSQIPLPVDSHTSTFVHGDHPWQLNIIPSCLCTTRHLSCRDVAYASGSPCLARPLSHSRPGLVSVLL